MREFLESEIPEHLRCFFERGNGVGVYYNTHPT